MTSQVGRRRNGLRLVAALAVLATLGVIAAGCGGSSPSADVANLTTTAGTTTSSGGAPESSSGANAPATAGGGTGPTGHIQMMTGASRAQALKFAQCMRSHGVPSFPDPSSDGSFSFSGDPKAMAGFQTASQSCRKLLPKAKPPSPAQQAQARQQAIKFSACMRSHGFPQFPDPTFSGNGIQLRLNKSAGMDPSSPRFQAAQRACQSYLPGKLGGTPKAIG